MNAIDYLTRDLANLQLAGEAAAKKGEEEVAKLCAARAREVCEQIEQLKRSVPQTTEAKNEGH